MINKDMPATPVMVRKQVDSNGRCAHMDEVHYGLTKREMFAMNAMQGILSNSGGVIQSNLQSGTGWCNSDANDLAKWSIQCADALLEGLEK